MDFLSQVLHNDPEVQAELASRNALDGLPGAAESGIDAATIEQVLLGEAAEGARGSEVRPLVATGMAAHQMRAEAVVLWEGRPSLLVRGGSYQLPDLRIWRDRLRGSTGLLERAIPSVCRIELARHPLGGHYPMIGTAWLVSEDVLVTNRHVAVIFGLREGGRFRFRSHPEGGVVEIRVDFLEEFGARDADEYEVAEIIDIEDDAGLDMAFLRIATSHPLAEPIVLGAPTRDEMIAAIGYPGKDPRAPAEKLHQIFDGKDSVKRLAPGMVMRPPRDSIFRHDCSTLKGSSGSVVVSLDTGKAVGLHYAGQFGVENRAVDAEAIKAKLSSLHVAVPVAWVEPAKPLSPADDTEESPESRQGYDPDFLGEERSVPLPGLRHASAMPISGDQGTELKYTHFSVVMHADRGLALCAAVNVNGKKLKRVPRGNNWRLDSRVGPGSQHGNELYRHNPYDRGHLVRRLDPVWGDNDTARQANADTFFYTNAAPQHKDLNQKIWNDLEDYVLDNADAHELKISVMTGPVFDAGDPAHRGVQIPRGFWKIVAFVDSEGELLASGYLLDQSHLITEIPEEFTFGAFKTFQVSIDLISRMTRLDLDVLIRADVLGAFESPQRMPLADLESIVLSPAKTFQLAECHGTRTRNTISLERFQELARDLDVPDSVLGDYLTEDHTRSSAFKPAVRIDPNHVSLPDEESALLMNSMNDIARWRRQRRYYQKVQNGWSGIRIVSEGDSWFQYPFLLKDVIDQLFERYAILSYGAAGDLFHDIIQQDEIAAGIAQEGADACLLSGGGNDLLGSGRLQEFLKPFASRRAPAEHLNDRFEFFLQGTLDLYESCLRRLTDDFPSLHVFVHGYDHAIPKNGRWLGKPMARVGYVDPRLQRQIVRVIIDRFNDGLADRSGRLPRVHHVDCRRVVSENHWHDELHPSNPGYAAVARRFRAAIDSIFG